MKIGIITQQLLNNYGCFLQNWALQQALIRLGHSPLSLDYTNKVPFNEWIRVNAKAFIRLPFPDRRRPFSPSFWTRRPEIFERFAREHISLSRSFSSYTPELIRHYSLDALLAGSDQIWRPMYNQGTLEDMFFSFAQDLSIPKCIYGASFGCNEWEYSPEQEQSCRSLATQLNAISVREDSGIDLCRDHLGVDAQVVVDPTLLLHSSDYESLCKDIRKEKEPYLLSYVLDATKGTNCSIQAEASKRNLKIRSIQNPTNFSIYSSSREWKTLLSIPEWLARFRDASYVVTDSYHGTIFSIIFGKEFLCLRNQGRGNARFDTLLSLSPQALQARIEESWHFLRQNLPNTK